ncbi:unnamed protein product [Phytomonas sp. Hart1]|nr:unnamed protein product [Phytomonas sp. Hart1]|eukprot:CCW67698.1 unnamed protein product [Phytomonas sp. isolate Hart1]
MAGSAQYDEFTCCHYLERVEREEVMWLWRLIALFFGELILEDGGRNPEVCGYHPRHGTRVLHGVFVQRIDNALYTIAVVTRDAGGATEVRQLLRDISRRLRKRFVLLFHPFPICASLRRVALRLWWMTSQDRIVPGAILPTLHIRLDDHRESFGESLEMCTQHCKVMDAIRGYHAVRLFLARPALSTLGGTCCKEIRHRRAHFFTTQYSYDSLGDRSGPLTTNNSSQTLSLMPQVSRMNYPELHTKDNFSYSDSTIMDVLTSVNSQGDQLSMSRPQEAPMSDLMCSSSVTVGADDNILIVPKTLISSSDYSCPFDGFITNINEITPSYVPRSSLQYPNEIDINNQASTTITSCSTTQSQNALLPDFSYPDFTFSIDRQAKYPEVYAYANFLFDDLRVDTIGEHLIGVEVDVENSYKPFIPALYGHVGPFLVVSEPNG